MQTRTTTSTTRRFDLVPKAKPPLVLEQTGTRAGAPPYPLRAPLIQPEISACSSASSGALEVEEPQGLQSAVQPKLQASRKTQHNRTENIAQRTGILWQVTCLLKSTIASHRRPPNFALKLASAARSSSAALECPIMHTAAKRSLNMRSPNSFSTAFSEVSRGCHLGSEVHSRVESRDMYNIYY